MTPQMRRAIYAAIATFILLFLIRTLDRVISGDAFFTRAFVPILIIQISAAALTGVIVYWRTGRATR